MARRCKAGVLALVVELAACALAPGPARADLTLAGRSTVLAMGMQGVGQETLWLKHTRIRRDLIDRGKAYSFLYDLDMREITVIDHSLRRAEVHAMKSLDQETGATVAGPDIRLELTPTGRKQAMQKWNCEEHELAFSMPVQIGAERLSFRLAGQVWLARKTREAREVKAYLKALQSEDFLATAPALNKIAAGQAQGIGAAIRRIAPMGLLCRVEVDLQYQGQGRVAELSRKLASHLGLAYERYHTRPIPEDTFAVPAGYQVVRK